MNTKLLIKLVGGFLVILSTLSSCWWIKGPKHTYRINDDSLFFTEMPPRTQSGADIIAFEIDGKPYVFPAKGANKNHFFVPPTWRASIRQEVFGEKAGLYYLNFMVNRKSEQFNPTRFSFSGLFKWDSGVISIVEGGATFGGYESEEGQFSWTIDHIDSVKRQVAGTFSGEVTSIHDKTKTLKIENGFFDLLYSK
ncbi:hypothetical protein HQ36_02565 [Porphyromonas gingivicanis]|uniref:Lipoprotein n=1 Tax=Porphyromonas gingivicanis TaxID=266762 RepID=A0A0A2GD16_9PORP|nr:hypothetical protein [Porphyromonas gingivicanis]KGN98319.1 hypothetical protein HQ36_02565 [Porphyromonas gingivicanis]